MQNADRWVYLFVRQDIRLEQQLVQASHAALTLGSTTPIQGIPNLILIGVPSQMDLLTLEWRLSSHGIRFITFEEPDFNLGLTAIATEPLDAKRKKALAEYRLWRPLCSCSSDVERPVERKFSGERVGHVHPGAPLSYAPEA